MKEVAIATDLAGEDPGQLWYQERANHPPGSHVDLANSRVQEGRQIAQRCTVRERPNALDPPSSTVSRRHRVRLLKMYVWFTEDDAALIRNISAARGQKPEDLIQLATLKLLAEPGAVSEERKRLLIPMKG